MPYFALIIMFYHVKIACYQIRHEIHEDDCVIKMGSLITCIYNLNSYLISLTFMLILRKPVSMFSHTY